MYSIASKLMYYKAIRFIILFQLLLLPALGSHAQIITGKVTDSETYTPIPNASVYLNGTYTGTTTDSLGKFSLKVTNTNIPLIISCLDYESQEINNYLDTSLLNIALKHRARNLMDVTINADDGMSRAKKMKIFLKEFIGSTNSDCVIVNPDDIWLRYNSRSQKLTAGANKPLIIYNKKLGYKIVYFLSSFSNVPLQTSYKGNYIFSEATAGLKAPEIKKVLQERDKVYWGSRMHFIRALWENKLYKNNFNVYRPFDTTSSVRKIIYKYNYLANDYDTTALAYRKLVKVVNDHIYHNQKFLVIPGEISITYGINNKKTSFIRVEGDYVGALIDSDGNYGTGLKWKGDMGISRVNRLLPNEFKPTGKIPL